MITIDFKLIFLYSASKVCFILLVGFLTGQLSLITKNSFAVQVGGFIEIETSCLGIDLFSKLNIIPNSCSMSLPRIKSKFNNLSVKRNFA